MKASYIIIEGKDVAIGYKASQQHVFIHQHLNFQLHAGELVCLLGSNGVGKSTLLRTLSGSQPLLYGQLILLQKSIEKYTEHQLAQTIGVVFTDKTFAGGLTVSELVALGRQPHTGFFGKLNNYDKEVIEHAIVSTGLKSKASRYMAELSDGERQKAMIAKALVQECPVILLDEPTAFLDVVSRIEIMNLLHHLAVKENKAILMSTHDIEQALILSDRLWLMSPECGIKSGTTEDLVLKDSMQHLFGTNTSITFNKLSGTYIQSVGGKQEIYVDVGSPTLMYWTRNALNRNGYTIAAEAKETIPHLSVHSANDIVYRCEHQTYQLSSFAELMRLL